MIAVTKLTGTSAPLRYSCRAFCYRRIPFGFANAKLSFRVVWSMGILSGHLLATIVRMFLMFLSITSPFANKTGSFANAVKPKI
mgnify:CR=1 FL=1